MLMRERYETVYGIHNHDAEVSNGNPYRPLALVAMHECEDSSTGSVLYERIELFAIREVPKYFGLSLKEFLEFPTDYCLHILEVCMRRQTKDSNAAQQALNNLGVGK
jgi:hypothetical protein